MVERLTAMMNLAKEGHLAVWMAKSVDPEAVLLHPALLHAASQCALLHDGQQFRFQPLEFLNLTLQFAEPNQPWLKT
jgi:hypothetical protein